MDCSRAVIGLDSTRQPWLRPITFSAVRANLAGGTICGRCSICPGCCRDSRPDRVVPGRRLPIGGALGHFAGRLACRVDGVPRHPVGGCRFDRTRRAHGLQVRQSGKGRLATGPEALQAQRPAREALNATPLNLTLAKPVISKENILLIEGLHDLFVEPEGVEELWQQWEQPEILAAAPRAR